MAKDSRRKVQIHLLFIGILAIGFVLIRYLLFGLHGMRQWPLILMLLCLVVIAVSFVVRAKITSVACSISYIIGFFLAGFFRTNGTDNGDGKINNLWIIWTIIIIVSVIVSAIIECLMSQTRDN